MATIELDTHTVARADVVSNFAPTVGASAPRESEAKTVTCSEPVAGTLGERGSENIEGTSKESARVRVSTGNNSSAISICGPLPNPPLHRIDDPEKNECAELNDPPTRACREESKPQPNTDMLIAPVVGKLAEFSGDTTPGTSNETHLEASPDLRCTLAERAASLTVPDESFPRTEEEDAHSVDTTTDCPTSIAMEKRQGSPKLAPSAVTDTEAVEGEFEFLLCGAKTSGERRGSEVKARTVVVV